MRVRATPLSYSASREMIHEALDFPSRMRINHLTSYHFDPPRVSNPSWEQIENAVDALVEPWDRIYLKGDGVFLIVILRSAKDYLVVGSLNGKSVELGNQPIDAPMSKPKHD